VIVLEAVRPTFPLGTASLRPFDAIVNGGGKHCPWRLALSDFCRGVAMGHLNSPLAYRTAHPFEVAHKAKRGGG